MSEDVNNKVNIGEEKWSFSSMPYSILDELSKAFKHGNKKYGYKNYKLTRVSERVYFDAAMRHILSFMDGEYSPNDAKDICHLDFAIANLMIIKEAYLEGNLKFDLKDYEKKPVPLEGKRSDVSSY